MRGMRPWLFLAGLGGLLAVAAGAWGWHRLEGDEDARRMVMLGVDYHMWHALALLGVAWLAEHRPSRLVSVAGTLFVAGIVLFSGSLYVYGGLGYVLVGGAAPAGGVCFMAGWGCLMAIALGRPRT